MYLSHDENLLAIRYKYEEEFKWRQMTRKSR